MSEEKREFKTGYINDVIIELLEKHEDGRGWLIEAFRADRLDHLTTRRKLSFTDRVKRFFGAAVEPEEPFYPAMGYLSETKPQQQRGAHEHAEQSDLFVFFNSTFRVVLWDNRPSSPTFGIRQEFDCGKNYPARVYVPPGVVHAYKNIGVGNGLVLNLPDRLYKGVNYSEPIDEYRHEDNPDTPFKVE